MGYTVPLKPLKVKIGIDPSVFRSGEYATLPPSVKFVPCPKGCELPQPPVPPIFNEPPTAPVKRRIQWDLVALKVLFVLALIIGWCWVASKIHRPIEPVKIEKDTQ